MKRFMPLAAVAGALACVVAVGSAQAAPVAGNALGKLATVGEAGATVEKAHYRGHRKWHQRKYWKKRYYKRHKHRHYKHRHYYKHRHWR